LINWSGGADATGAHAGDMVAVSVREVPLGLVGRAANGDHRAAGEDQAPSVTVVFAAAASRSRFVSDPPGNTDGMTLTTRMLTPHTWDDFAALVEANNGVWGGCWCMGFHPEGVGAGHSPEGNREAKRRHVTRGTVHQVLVYDGDHCVGWCQFGPPPELPNIKNRRTYDQGTDDPPDSPPPGSRRHWTRSGGPVVAPSRPIPSRPSSGRRSVAPTCTPDRRSCTRDTASRGYAGSRSGGGSCAPRSEPGEVHACTVVPS
jgi:hypothetical protein